MKNLVVWERTKIQDDRQNAVSNEQNLLNICIFYVHELIGGTKYANRRRFVCVNKAEL